MRTHLLLVCFVIVYYSRDRFFVVNSPLCRAADVQSFFSAFILLQ